MVQGHNVSVSKAYSEVNGRLVLGEPRATQPVTYPCRRLWSMTFSCWCGGNLPRLCCFRPPKVCRYATPTSPGRYYEPARQLASTSVSRVQAALGITETRRGLSIFGDDTLAALTGLQYDLELPNAGAIGEETWRALASQTTGSPEQRELLRSVRIVLEFGDMDFRPPVFHDLRHTAVSL